VGFGKRSHTKDYFGSGRETTDMRPMRINGESGGLESDVWRSQFYEKRDEAPLDEQRINKETYGIITSAGVSFLGGRGEGVPGIIIERNKREDSKNYNKGGSKASQLGVYGL
jgi:hypothetical protein